MLKKDIEVLRRLADQLAELSQLPIQKERKQQWYHLNARKVDKPMFLMGEFPWNEMNIDDELTLQCEDPFYREMETTLRQLLYRNKHIQDDWVYEPFIYIPKVIRGLNFGLDIIEEKLTRDDGNVVEAHSYFSQLQDWDDINKINVPNFYLDEEETNRRPGCGKVAERASIASFFSGSSANSALYQGCAGSIGGPSFQETPSWLRCSVT